MIISNGEDWISDSWLDFAVSVQRSCVCSRGCVASNNPSAIMSTKDNPGISVSGDTANNNGSSSGDVHLSRRDRNGPSNTGITGGSGLTSSLTSAPPLRTRQCPPVKDISFAIRPDAGDSHRGQISIGRALDFDDIAYGNEDTMDNDEVIVGGRDDFGNFGSTESADIASTHPYGDTMRNNAGNNDDVYVSQLQNVFSSCDVTNQGYLDECQLRILCDKLDVNDQADVIVKRLMNEQVDEKVIIYFIMNEYYIVQRLEFKSRLF